MYIFITMKQFRLGTQFETTFWFSFITLRFVKLLLKIWLTTQDSMSVRTLKYSFDT